jgi:hypothetical protein
LNNVQPKSAGHDETWAAWTQAAEEKETRSELDSHASTCVIGCYALVTHDFDRPVNITGFDPSCGTVEEVQTVSAALAYDDLTSGVVRILIIHQAILFGPTDHNLLCPMQLRMNDVRVEEIPNFY